MDSRSQAKVREHVFKTDGSTDGKSSGKTFVKNWEISSLHYGNKRGLPLCVCVSGHRAGVCQCSISKLLLKKRITSADGR